MTQSADKPTTTASTSDAAVLPKTKRGNADVKHDKLMKMLLRSEGATKAEIGAETEWLEHTAGARISGIKNEYTVTKVKEKGRGTVYRAIKK